MLVNGLPRIAKRSMTASALGSDSSPPVPTSAKALPRFQADKQCGFEIANAFFAASRNGDMTALGAMLAVDVTCTWTAAAPSGGC